MALTSYKNKRSQADTPEPTGGKAAGNALHFVVQKHKATRLHYDFRLELKGVLKSWAVPKGPSLNPGDKRLAMAVEDHPYDYKDFEGKIPKGNYGAGTVIVWDEGTYEPVVQRKGKSAQARAISAQYKAGSMKFVLNGKKLKGEFALVRMKSDKGDAWLLMKHDDRYAKTDDVRLSDKSVKSGKTLEQIAKGGTKEKKARTKKNAKASATKADIKNILNGAKRKTFPSSLSPMLATLTDEPFDDADWEYEVKWDGYRAIAFLNGNKTKLVSRNGNTYNDRFRPVYDALQAWGIRAVVDGELVAVNQNGVINFNTLQNWHYEEDGNLLFYVFDLLWYQGKDLTALPLIKRKAVLRSLMPPKGIIRMGFSVAQHGTALFDATAKLGLEGVIAKRSNSQYLSGVRSPDWLKVKYQRRQEVIIAGYTLIENTPRPFSSLLLGVYENGKLRYAGKVGTGFTMHEQRNLLAQFKLLVRKTSPFFETPDYDKPTRFRPVPSTVEVTWLRPTLVCEIRFTELTEGGLFRHPAFIAMRTDKDAQDVIKEYPKMEKQQTRKVNGIELNLTNLDKVYWPEEGYTKGDLLAYYNQIAPYILPYLKRRPQSLNRYPNGITGEHFFQKDVTGKVPDWVEKYPYKAEGDKRRKHYMLCNNKASLLYMANLGAIEMNPWSSTVDHPENPDWCILDLDPDTGNTFQQVIEVAQAIHSLLNDLSVPCYCKTSGSTGLHVYIPLGAKYRYDQSQLFAKWIATRVDDGLRFTSIERATNRRKGNVYIDYLQNKSAATLAAPYSLRPKPGATVSMPLHWDEVTKGLDMADFTIENTFKRLKATGDLFKPVLKKGIDLKKILAKISE